MIGFDSAGETGEETRDPQRVAPRTILAALAASGAPATLLVLAALPAAPALVVGVLAAAWRAARARTGVVADAGRGTRSGYRTASPGVRGSLGRIPGVTFQRAGTAFAASLRKRAASCSVSGRSKMNVVKAGSRSTVSAAA